MQLYCGGRIFVLLCGEAKATHTHTHRYNSPSVWLQRPHTHTVQKKKEKLNSPHPSILRVKRMLGKRRKVEKGMGPIECLYILRYPATGSSWMSLHRTHMQRRSIKK